MIERLQYLKDNYHLPQDHVDYLVYMRDHLKIYPRVIYDIGACTLHWAEAAQTVWPDSYIIAFEGMQSCAELYESIGIDYHIDLLGEEGRRVDFYENPHDPAGNSYYQENPEINPQASTYYNQSHKTSRTTRSLDRVIVERKFHPADLIKLDVQGAELDILKNAPKALMCAKNIILETQSSYYNQGAPLDQEITQFLLDNNFQLKKHRFSGTDIQGDSHFGRKL